MPASKAASTTRAVAAASMRQPKLLHPRPTTDTLSEPIERFSTHPLIAEAALLLAPLALLLLRSGIHPDCALPHTHALARGNQCVILRIGLDSHVLVFVKQAAVVHLPRDRSGFA